MEKDRNNGLFGSLKNLGLNLPDTLDLYHDQKEEKKEETGARTKEPDPSAFVYDRKVQCPACEVHTSVKAVKSFSIRVLSRDTDFMVYYGDPNPLVYDIWFCKKCGYAALSTRFPTISDGQKKLIRENITHNWKFTKEYPPLYDADTAAELYQLALLNAVVKRSRNSEKAMLCLKLAWVYRLKQDEGNEIKYLSQALQGFIRAYGEESFPVAGMDDASLKYLIGELYRRTGDAANALLWFSKVLGDRNAKARIKDMARDQKDLIRETEKSEGAI